MNKKSVLVAVVLFLCGFGSVGFGKPWKGNGTANSPYQIWDANDMQAIGADANYWGAHFKLMADIDLAAYTGTSYNIIGEIFLASPHGIALDITDGKMYWVDFGTERICRANLDGTGIEPLVTRLDLPYDIVLDLAGGKMYWTDYGTDKIQRANLDGTGVEDLRTTGLSSPRGIALDVSGGKMYWTDAGTGKICRANLDGTGVEDLVTGLNSSYGIALDAAGGKMYWTMATGKIQRANLDGTEIEDLVTESLDNLRGIALDVAGGKMYWIDWFLNKIQRANLDGTEVEDLVTTRLSYPIGIALDVAGGKMYWTDSDTDKIQVSNLDGTNIFDALRNGFTGVFDGDGHTISNFTYEINDIYEEIFYIGVFGYIEDPNAEVKNLGLIDPNIKAASGYCYYVGSLAGYIEGGTISGCYVEGGSVTGGYSVGGLVGDNWSGSILECYSTASVRGKRCAGGLSGHNRYEGIISNCYSTGDVNVTGIYYIGGGLVGHNMYEGIISNCYSTGDVTGVDWVGGLVGYNEFHSSISDSYSTGDVTGNEGVGGLVGWNERNSNISNSYSEGTVAGVDRVGGLIGENEESDIENCYSQSDVTGEDFVGGLVGWNERYSHITNSYSTGSVAGIGNDVGGLVGWGISSYVMDSFWDVNSSGIDTSVGGTGLPTFEMQTESTYTDAGWDFVGETVNGTEDIWKINCEGMSYPKLSWWEPALGDFICPDGVDMVDFAVLGDAWMSAAGDLNWDAGCDISEPEDEVIDGLDLAVFVGNWLEGT